MGDLAASLGLVFSPREKEGICLVCVKERLREGE